MVDSSGGGRICSGLIWADDALARPFSDFLSWIFLIFVVVRRVGCGRLQLHAADPPRKRLEILHVVPNKVDVGVDVGAGN